MRVHHRFGGRSWPCRGAPDAKRPALEFAHELLHQATKRFIDGLGGTDWLRDRAGDLYPFWGGNRVDRFGHATENLTEPPADLRTKPESQRCAGRVRTQSEASPKVSATYAPRVLMDRGEPVVVSLDVWCSISVGGVVICEMLEIEREAE